ncbi:uncharacterized protein BDV14DRAFT_182258 [Aspergillus stella-maris]|uniref:uncharacterized protein n=1 Tax=Aspergillus stella-maris TaxID=1810926 RepID=UPI003CCD674B
MSQEDIRRAVQILLQAPDDALFAVRTELLGAFISLRKRLRLPTDRCIEALDALSAKTEEIEGKQADVASVIGEISSRQADVRLQHIYAEQPGGKGFGCRVQAIFAYRSLGFEFDEYTISQHGASRVTELASDFRKADDRSSGLIHEFLKEKGLENDSPGQKAVRFAIKVLVLERTFGECGISWLVSFIFSKIRNLPYLELANLCDLLSQRDGDYSTLGELANSFSNLIRTGQQQYDALVSPDVIVQDPHQNRPECLTEHTPASDLLAVTEASVERNPDPSVDSLASSPYSGVSAPSSRSSQNSDTTPEAGVSLSDPHGASSLHDHVFQRELADRGQTIETGRTASADHERDGAGLRPPKRKRTSLHAREQSRTPSVGSRSQINGSNAPTPAHAYSDGLNSQSRARWRPSYMGGTPIGSPQYLSSNTNFWSVVDDRTIDEASSHNPSGPIPSTVPHGQSATSQQHVQPFVHSNEQDGSQTLFPVRPSPPSAFTCSSTKQSDAQIISAGQPHLEGHTDSLHDQRASSGIDQNYLPSTTPAQSLSLDPSNNILTNPSLVETQQCFPQSTAVHLSTLPC